MMEHSLRLFTKNFVIYGICECKHKFSFVGKSSEPKLDFNNSAFTPHLVCPNCNKKYSNFIKEESSSTEKLKGKFFIYGVISLIVIGFLYGVSNMIFNDNSPTYKNINDATHKEFNDFMNWDKKQQQDKYDNSKVGN